MAFSKNYPCVYCGKSTPLCVTVQSGVTSGLGTACAKAGDKLAVCAAHQAAAHRDMEAEIAEQNGVLRERRYARQSGPVALPLA